MRFVGFRTLICILFAISTFGCGIRRIAPPELVQKEDNTSQVILESSRKAAPEAVEEYAKIHQISNLKTAEFYLTNPDYAREHPYTPTSEDITHYEREFLEKTYPKFKELAEKKGFMEARHIYMSNPADGPGNLNIGSSKYITAMRQLALGDGEGASTGRTNPMLEEDSAAEHYQEGTRLYRQDRLDDATGHMEEALKAKPDSPTLLYNLGVAYMEKGDNDKASQLFQNTLEYIKGTAYTKVNLAMYPEIYMGASINLGLIYASNGMYEEAVRVLEEAIRFRPGRLDANWNLGYTYWSMGDLEKTAEQMRKCIELDPDNAEAHNIIGLTYYCKRLYEAALKEFRIAVNLNPDEKQYTYNEALVLARMDRYDEVSQSLEKASGLEEGEYLRQVYEEQVSINKAKKLYNEGYNAMQRRDLNRAVELFESALKLNPDMLEAHVNLGVCYRTLGDRQKQIHHFEEAIRLKPDMPDVHYNLGLAYSDTGMYPQAIVEFRRSIELGSSSRNAHFKLGTTLYKTGNYKDAAAEFEKCLQLSPKWFEACLNLGSCYLKTGRLSDAIEQFGNAIKLNPGSAEAHYSLGTAYMKAKKYDEASALFKKALEIDPSHSKSRMTLEELEAYRGK